MQGSRIYKDNIAAANDALVDVLEDSGAIIIGKTNTPEFGAGANTFNEYAITNCHRRPPLAHCVLRILHRVRMGESAHCGFVGSYLGKKEPVTKYTERAKFSME